MKRNKRMWLMHSHLIQNPNHRVIWSTLGDVGTRRLLIDFIERKFPDLKAEAVENGVAISLRSKPGAQS